MRVVIFIGLLIFSSFNLKAQEEITAALDLLNAAEDVGELNLASVDSYYGAGDLKTAFKEITKWKKQYPNNVQVLLYEAQILMDQKKYKASMKNLDRVLVIDNKSVRAYYLRGLVKDLTGEPLNAIVEFSQSIRLDSTYALSYEGRGTTKSKLGDNFSAIEDYSKALQFNENLTLANMGRGLAYHNTAQYDKAILDFVEVLKENSRNGLAVYYLGLSRLKTGDAGGCGDLRQALNMGIAQANLEIQKYCQ